jgi:long-chain acyl-CoA synthetase
MSCFIHGDALKNHIVAIIYPDPEELAKWCKQQGIGSEDETHAERCKHPEVFKQIASDFAIAWKANNLTGLEKLGLNFAIVGEEFKVGVVLTPTMKIKRKIAREFYAEQISDIYKKSDERLEELKKKTAAN